MSKITAQEQATLDAHFLRCHYDFAYFAKTNIKIQDENNELVPLILNEEQLILEEIIADIQKNNRLVRLYCLKGRKQGVSTYWTGRSLWMITSKGKLKNTPQGVAFDGLVKNQNACVIAHDPRTTQYLYEMFKRMDANLQPEFQQDKLKCNGYMIHYQNETGDGLDSSVMLGSADTKDFGSGMTLTIRHCSELAKYPPENVKSLLTSLDNAMPIGKNTAVLNESTAKGLGGAFHEGFISCRYVYEAYQDENQVVHWTVKVNEDADPMNEYSSVFLPWYVARKYRMAVPSDFKRTPEEEQWVKKFNLCDEQLVWYRHCLANRCSGDKSTRQQEFPFTSKEAFLASGTPSFDVPRIIHFKDLCTPPIARYECLSGGQFIANTEGEIKVWKEPKAGKSYVISADVAEGLSHGDFNSADVLDHETGEQVAHYHGKCEPYQYAHLLYWLGMRYNEAWLVPEKNNHGHSVIQELVRLDYENIYMEMIEEPPAKPRKRFGWVTVGQGGRKRQAMIDNGKKIIAQADPGIRCAETYDEMLNFKRQNDGREEADLGTFDDRTISWLIGQFVRETLPFIIPKKRTGRTGDGGGRSGKQKRPSNKAWQ